MKQRIPFELSIEELYSKLREIPNEILVPAFRMVQEERLE